MINIIASNLFAINRYAKELAKFHIDIQKENTEILPTVKEKLMTDMSNTQMITDKEKNKISEYLNSFPDGNRICHFDFHPGNIIISSDKPIIIDWMTACVGCRRCTNGDIA